MRVLIAGGTGLIGSALIGSLRDSNCEVTVLTRSPERSQALMQSGVRLVRWDGETAEGWSHLVSQVDAIVNLAGEGIADGRWSTARKERIRQSRVRAGNALVSAIRDAESVPKTLIQSSAVGYYGPGKDEIMTEQAPPGEDFLANVCSEWEASTAEVEAMGVRRVVIRTGVVLSSQRRRPAQNDAPFPTVCRWASGQWQTVLSLDPYCRRGGCHPLSPGERKRFGSLQPRGPRSAAEQRVCARPRQGNGQTLLFTDTIFCAATPLWRNVNCVIGWTAGSPGPLARRWLCVHFP